VEDHSFGEMEAEEKRKEEEEAEEKRKERKEREEREERETARRPFGLRDVKMWTVGAGVTLLAIWLNHQI
jgi:hypothetical protein